jgi:outer membrane protein TolC
MGKGLTASPSQTTEKDQAQSRGALLNALVTIYKAMGGGWVMEAEQRTRLEFKAKRAK